MRAYRADSSYSDRLKPCVFAETVEASCSLARLPFISTDGTTPTVEQIMERLLVSHDWMAVRFEEVLRAAPPDLLRVFGSTTAVLIGSDVRPSFYYSLNAAIQLDPIVLWQTVAEKRTVSTAPDFRTDYGRDLLFDDFQRPVIDGRQAVQPFDMADERGRTFEDTQVPVMQLLFHELAHAIDAMPLNQIAGLDPSLKVFEAIVQVQQESLSWRLYDAMPLTSGEMVGLADVRYRGTKASQAQRASSAADVGGFFGSDAAMKFYGYVSVREDVATLMEAALMKLHYDVELNIGFVDKPADASSLNCADYLVGWGVRNRLAEPSVAARARFLIEEGLGGSVDTEQLFGDSLGVAEPMAVGVDWCTNNETPTAMASRRRTEPDDAWLADRFSGPGAQRAAAGSWNTPR